MMIEDVIKKSILPLGNAWEVITLLSHLPFMKC